MDFTCLQFVGLIMKRFYIFEGESTPKDISPTNVSLMKVVKKCDSCKYTTDFQFCEKCLKIE